MKIGDVTNISTDQSELEKRIEVYKMFEDAIYKQGISNIFFSYTPFRFTFSLKVYECCVKIIAIDLCN